ncbi:hypothetical protein (plasmid) [Erwinia amylovora ATCC 49946]|nr:hypothetical protein [Erwinia amylovora ATCC 49946]
MIATDLSTCLMQWCVIGFRSSQEQIFLHHRQVTATDVGVYGGQCQSRPCGVNAIQRRVEPAFISAVIWKTFSATPGRRVSFTSPVSALFGFRPLAGAVKKDARRQRYFSFFFLSGLFMLRFRRSIFGPSARAVPARYRSGWLICLFWERLPGKDRVRPLQQERAPLLMFRRR